MSPLTERLDIDLLRAPRLSFGDDERIAIVCDFHMGVGDYADDFAHNAPIALYALETYLYDGFTLILAGDMEELWENANPRTIIAAHYPIYHLFQRFHERGRLIKLYGNHDELWKRPAMVRRYLWYTRYGRRTRNPTPLLKGLQVHAALLLIHRPSTQTLLVIHGHQGDPHWLYPPARLIVRYFWRFLQRYGFRDPTSPAQNNHRRIILEERLARWVHARYQPILSGHTHHPLFPPQGDVPYYNAGSGVHPYSVTAMEIREGNLLLVKWSRSGSTNHGPICREVMAGPRPFAELGGRR